MSMEPLSYAQSGVNIDEAGRALKSVSAAVKASHTTRVLSGIGGFGAVFDASFPELGRPALVATIDGVGTKTKVAAMAGQFKNLGLDIVHHCANDALCQGARPLFFLDYYGCSQLESPVFTEVVTGMAEACAALGIALIGGETAEMPGVYHDSEIDIVGCLVGVVDADNRLPRTDIAEGDVLIGLTSDGLHTNGFSLARRALLEVGGLSLRDPLSPESETTLADALLAPHRCYAKSLLPLISEGLVLGLAHITGGGIPDNLPRMLPEGTSATIHRDRWEVPALFRLIQSNGQIELAEMERAFNMGIGMIVATRAHNSRILLDRLTEAGESPILIGEVTRGHGPIHII